MDGGKRTEPTMLDLRNHRGPHPEDRKLFAPACWPALRAATSDLSWLLGRGYASKSAVKIVGDRYALDKRQRIAVARCACSEERASERQSRCVPPEQDAGEDIWIDGFNVLTTIEAALGGGVILQARDGCYRDMASMHGSYRQVAETLPAIELVGRQLMKSRVAHCRWLLDSPVSNSGRVKRMLEKQAEENGWNWKVDLVPDPDKLLSKSEAIVASSDSAILDRCSRWFNLAALLIETIGAKVVDLSRE